jgi:hypothetical protein
MLEITPPNELPVTAASNPDPTRDKAVRLFRYLGALTSSRSATSA